MTQKLVLSLLLSLVGFSAHAGTVKTVQLFNASTRVDCSVGFICADAKIEKAFQAVIFDGSSLSYVVEDADIGNMRIYLEKALPCDPSVRVSVADLKKQFKKIYVDEEAGTWSDRAEELTECEAVPMM